MKQHPLSAAYPAMADADYKALVQDIRTHGQRDVATLYDGMVLDGWHRYQACKEIGIPCRFEHFKGDDPAAFVISKNTYRRQLTASQRAAAVVAVRAWRPADAAGKRTNRDAPPAEGTAAALPPSATNRQMAQEAGVSERTVRQVKRGVEAGLGGAMRDGQVSAERAAEIAKMPEPERAAAVADPAVKPEPPKAEQPAPSVGIDQELVQLREQYAELQQINERLEAMASGEEEVNKLIADLQKRLARSQAFVKTVESQRDMAQAEANQLKAEVKRLRREIAACKK